MKSEILDSRRTMSMIRRESFGSADDGVVLETHDALYRLLLEPDAPALSSSVESSVRASPSEDPRSYRRERSRSRSLAERISRARLSRAPTVRVLDVVACINNGRTRTREEIDCGRQKEMA